MKPKKSILIIDDEKPLRLTLALILQRAGYQVITANGSQDALETLGEREFDLVFLDLNLSEDNGLTLLPEIKKIHPELPVVILTAHITQESRNYARQKGACEYLLKPIYPGCILEVVVKMLEQQNRSRSNN